MPRIDCPRSVGDGDRMPTGQIFFTAPLSIERNRTSASAARPSISVGVASAILTRWSVARVMEIAIGDPRAAQEKHLQEPVQQDGDLAEKERAVEVRRQQHIIEREQRHRQNGGGAEDIVEIGDRREPPFVAVQAEDEINRRGIDQENRQQNLKADQPLVQAADPRNA